MLEKYTNEHSRFLVIGRNLVHYRIEGEGFPLLLLHGAFSSLHTFDEWTKQLAHHFQIIRLDLPGFGLTGAIAENKYSIQHIVQFIHKFLNTLKIKELHIAGNSLGGWLGWEYALLHPDRVKKLVLIDSAGFLDLKSVPVPFRMARTPFMNKVVKYAISKNILEGFVKEVYYNKSKVNTELVNRYYELFSREGNPEAFFKFVNQHFIDNTRLLKNINQPTLILWGKEDKWIPVENAYRFHQKIPHNEMIIYEQTGHVPMEEIPIDTAHDVKAFLL
ncbi:MAG: alpha/beta hydrolase [Flammeovirgaceae bacterium]